MNPITYARITAHISKQEFPRKLGVSRTYTIRSEQGCYVKPNEKISNFACATLGIDYKDFMKQYQEFQNEQRAIAINQRDIEPIRFIREGYSPVESSVISPEVTTYYMHSEFSNWRKKYYTSLITFSSSLCLHPTSVELYEKGHYRTLPGQIRDVLTRFKLIGDLDPTRGWIKVTKS